MIKTLLRYLLGVGSQQALEQERQNLSAPKLIAVGAIATAIFIGTLYAVAKFVAQ